MEGDCDVMEDETEEREDGGSPGYADDGGAGECERVGNAVPDAAAAAGDHDGLSGEGQVGEGGGDGWVG